MLAEPMANIFGRWFGRKRDDSPVRDVAALAAPLAAPAVHVVKTDAPSRSHFGGSPHLPPGMAWPVRNGNRLGFLARVSLAEMRRAHVIEWLPDAGALLFFYDLEAQPWGFDPKDRGSWAVLLAPDLPEPVSQAPAGVERQASELSHRNVAFRRVDVLPSVERHSVELLGLSEAEGDRYCDLAETVCQEAPKHQIAGFPAPIQGDDMELECQLASNGLYCGDGTASSDRRAESLTPGAANWKLLLQFDSDEALGVMWGDAGMIYYWIEADAAREGRFENTWLILQCH
jgi:uncharacterized protein YwqG